MESAREAETRIDVQPISAKAGRNLVQLRAFPTSTKSPALIRYLQFERMGGERRSSSTRRSSD